MSDYSPDDEVYDPDAYIVEMINDLRRDAEGLKLDGKHSQIGLKMLGAADALEDLLSQNDLMLEKLLEIEHIVSKVIR